METSEGLVSLSADEKPKAEIVNPEDSGEEEGAAESDGETENDGGAESDGGTENNGGSESDGGAENEGGAESEGGSGSEWAYDLEEEWEREVDIEELCKWGYDSFEGHEYHSSDMSDQSDKEIEKQVRYYHRHVIETKGFFESSDGFPNFRIGGISGCSLEESAGRFGTCREFCTKLTSVCIQRYNEEKKEKIELESVLRANVKGGGIVTFYITFLAKEFDGSMVEYQAKAVWCIDGHDTIYPMLCRPTKPV